MIKVMDFVWLEQLDEGNKSCKLLGDLMASGVVLSLFVDLGKTAFLA